MKKLLFILIFILSSNLVHAQKVVIIVHASNPVTAISLEKLQDFYYKRVRTWSDGNPVRFFDRSENSQIRNLFLKQMLGRTSRQVDQFWIGQKFNSGDSAPTQVSSDTMTMNLVSRFPGGISYVDEQTPLQKNVKIISVSGL